MLKYLQYQSDYSNWEWYSDWSVAILLKHFFINPEMVLQSTIIFLV